MNPGRILVVDDEPQLTKLITRYLEHQGYEVLALADPQDAWARLEREPGAFALAIIDLTIEGAIRGEELARRFLTADPAARVILTSGYAADVAAVENTFPGRVSFLQKPFSGEMLSEAVSRLSA